MTGQAAGFWKPRHAVIALAVLGLLVLMIRGCSGDSEDAIQRTESESEIPMQGRYVQIPATELQRYADVPPGYPQPDQQPGYIYRQQRVDRQPPQYLAVDPDNPWAVPVPTHTPPQAEHRYQPQQSVTVQQWGQPQQPVYTELPGNSRYRPLDESSQDRQSAQRSHAAPLPPAWSGAPYDRRAGSSFGNNSAGSAWGGGYTGYGYPVYPGTAYGAGAWPPAPAYPLYGVPGRW